MVRTTKIPAGKHAGKHREALEVSYSGTTGGGPYTFTHIVCGSCRTKYKAFKTACPSCGGNEQ